MPERYQNNSQQRILRVLMCLFGHEVSGLAPGELAKLADISPQDATRDLANLRIAGLAEQMPESGRWRLTPRLPQKALAMLNAINRAAAKIEETQQRYTRNPY
ncbi:MAG: IclR family transcriptional regulator [Pseudomonadota bacterium]